MSKYGCLFLLLLTRPVPLCFTASSHKRNKKNGLRSATLLFYAPEWIGPSDEDQKRSPDLKPRLDLGAKATCS